MRTPIASGPSPGQPSAMRLEPRRTSRSLDNWPRPTEVFRRDYWGIGRRSIATCPQARHASKMRTATGTAPEDELRLDRLFTPACPLFLGPSTRHREKTI